MKNVIRIIFFSLFFVFPFGQLLRYQITAYPSVRIHLLEAFVLMFNVLIFSVYYKKRKNIKLPLWFKTILFFVLTAFISLIITPLKIRFLEIFISSFYLLRVINFILLYLTITVYLREEKINVNKLLLFSGFFSTIIALLQYLFLPDLRFLLPLGWDEHYYRAAGSFLDPGFTGIIIVFTIILLLNNWSKIVKNKYLNILFILLLLISLVLTFSRAAYLSFILSLVVFAYLKKKSLILIIILIALVVLVFLIPKPGGEGVNLLRTTSILARSKEITDVLNIIKSYPVLGVGFNTLRYAKNNFGLLSEYDWQTSNSGAGTDNSFLFVLATTGILGLIFFIWSIFLLFKETLRKGGENSILIISTLTAVIISSIFANTLFYPWVLFWLAIVLSSVTFET